MGIFSKWEKQLPAAGREKVDAIGATKQSPTASLIAVAFGSM